MKLIPYTYLLALCLCITTVQPASAQFEGEILYHLTNPSQEIQEANSMYLLFTKDRIYVDSSSDMNVMAGLRTNGILVRNDQQDFVLMMGNNEGLKVAKSELESMAAMINRIQGRSNVQPVPFPWDEKVIETNNRKDIHGYTVQQFILNGDNPGEFVSVWLTNQIKVNWGLLLEAWYSTGKKQFDNEIPIEMVMNKSSFPLLIEVYRDESIVFQAESITVNTRNLDRTKTEISPDLKLLSFTDMMMNFFRQQR